jgi:Fe-S-cluster containining protein
MTSFKIHLSPDQNFSCHACGKCCTNKFQVLIEPEKLATIQATQAYLTLERQGYTPIELVDGKHRVTRKESGECRFLNQNRCEIHAEAGVSEKPEMCQIFPFILVDTPDGHFVSMSYACPSVLANKGQPATQHLRDLRKFVDESTSFKVTNPPSPVVKITERRTVDWKEYLEIEKRLIDTVGVDNPVQDIVKAVIMLIVGQAAPALEYEATYLLSIFAADTISVIEREHLKEERTTFSNDLLEDGADSHLLEVRLPRFEIHQPEEEITKSAISRYVRSLILGKRLISGTTVVTRLLLLATALSILLFYLRTRTESKPETLNDLEWTFNLIESNIFTHAENLEPLFLDFERAIIPIRL